MSASAASSTLMEIVPRAAGCRSDQIVVLGDRLDAVFQFAEEGDPSLAGGLSAYGAPLAGASP